ncbi:hypothetical protein L4B25_15205 [Salmonella enterica subsp. diarizonae serovar 16:z10:e,n,x,z15]|uniref:hypothetical protein n=1 Tax=Salmonella enterica TaxID=28901 RepID=UPI0012D68730|nr:hypothetical protein [Salmonella enterica]ECQ8979537.1 hypothetical protein [Salmonella enterica subsp. enterica]EDU6369158.1 hypothetical protein [Salmonella enterica subsp. houtenae serovar 40:z4,z24:-]MCH5493723.1 hypothetical protein [Salmonella enterica subsp. diarizonae serovar 16:z10:e,n,x,z15]ECC6921268.1 hypothetical protein [Salmonella enterica]
MSLSNNKVFAAFNVSFSVILTALLIGFASRSTGDETFAQKLMALMIAYLFFTLIATHTILSILTKNKQNQ